MNIVITIGLLTILVSFLSFRKPELMEKLDFSPFQIKRQGAHYRWFSHGLVHADWMHLIINMMVFFSFGVALLSHFGQIFGDLNSLLFAVMYVFSIPISSLWDYSQHKDHDWYHAVGASGAVSAVVFADIFFDPWHKIYFFAVLPIPGILFAILYLGYSYYMGKKANDNIGHNAHFFGALFGFSFPIIIKPELFYRFIEVLIS